MTKIDRIRALAEADPSNAFAWYSLAMEEKKTDLPAALATFERVRTQHPKYVPNYYHYAQALVTSGDNERAKQIYKEGMATARAAGDMHAYGELESALDLIS